MKDFKKNLVKILTLTLFVTLVILGFWDKPNQIALNFISSVFEETSSSLLLLSELKIGATSGASLKVPLLSGSFSGVESMLGEGMQYLEFASLLLGLQLLALTLSKSIILKVLMLIAIFFVFLEKSKVMAFKLLIVFLMINPGLSIYTIGVKLINKEVNVDLGTNLNEELKRAHKDYLIKEKAHESKLQDQKNEQLKEEDSKGEEHLSFLDRAKDTIEKVAYKAEDDVSLAFNDTLVVLKAAGQKVIGLCLNLFTHVLFLFFLLPLGYYYIMKYLLYDLITPLKQQPQTNEN